MIGPKHYQIVNLRASGICKPACAICASSGFSERKDKAGFKPLSQNHGRGTSWPARIIHSAMFAPVTPPRATSFTQHAPRHGQQASPRGSRCLPVAALVVPLTWHELGAAQPEEKADGGEMGGYASYAMSRATRPAGAAGHSAQPSGRDPGRHEAPPCPRASCLKAWFRVRRKSHTQLFPGRTLTISRPA